MATASDPLPSLPTLAPSDIGAAPASADRWMSELHALLRELEAVTSAGETLPPVFSEAVDDRLVQLRLGVASSLFAALQCKNAAIAGHALRVTLTCSAWALRMDLPAEQRDAIEIAALLHDIGVIGAPDHILQKAGMLDSNEAAVMARARKMSLNILRRSCNAPQVLEIVEYVSAWYDGSRSDRPWRGGQIPLGARMIAIAEAFDAMTTDHVYRRARSQERATAELFECAGTQFDPELVRRFAEFRQSDQTAVHWEVAHRWLRSLDSPTVDSYWELSRGPLPEIARGSEANFHGRLLDNMYDAVVFIDAAGHVVQWNRGAERLTGMAGASLLGQAWDPELLGLADEKGQPVSEADCPVHTALGCGVQSLRRMAILGRGRRATAVDVHTMPVINEKGVTEGAVLLFHDASSELSLEQRCQSLYDKATKDPLTQVANRGELERVHATFVAAHQQQQVPCSLMMCDLDRFKRVNDNYGHQAGDEAIQSLASLLKSSCRPGDLVARYGGEEFVVLCADCDNATAARRAEQIRKALSQIPQPKMGGRSITVSFGVTEIQPGDTPETMLRRADRALLTAKANGRNAVVQLGAGGGEEAPKVERSGWFFGASRPKEVLQQELIAWGPVKLAVEKLRGFVADHRAKISVVEENRVVLEIDEVSPSRHRRMGDRSVVFSVEVRFAEERIERDRMPDGERAPSGHLTRTRIEVTVSPRRNRDRRRNDVMARARRVLVSFRSYLMAAEDDASSIGAIGRAKHVIASWKAKDA